MKNFFTYPFSWNTNRQLVFLLVCGVLFFIPLLGYVHLFDWDEINFAESSREMLTSGDWFHVQINYEPFWEKPPLFFWIQSSSMAIFGVNEFGARFPNALFGIITLWLLYRLGSKHHNPTFGMMWALVYAGSLLPHIYFKSGIIDPVFNFFIFLSVYHLMLNLREGNAKNALYAGLFSGLAILTKGPVGLLLVLLTYAVYVVFTKFKSVGKPLHIIYYILVCGGISLIWVVPEISANGISILGDFIYYQYELLTQGVAGHEQPFYYHFVVVLLGCFPMSVLAIPAFRFSSHTDEWNFARWMRILFWVVLILFTIVKTKIVHYSSMCWLPLSYLAARELATMDTVKMRKWMSWIYLGFGLLLGALVTVLPVLMIQKESWVNNVKDSFAQACIMLPVAWSYADMTAGFLLLVGITIGFILLKNQHIKPFLINQVFMLAIVLTVALITIVPKIEMHSQRPAIEYFESFKGKDVYVWPVGYKSYAHWFYFEVPATENNTRKNEDTLLFGKVNKPVYFITKYNSDFLDRHTEIAVKTGEKGGFKFYRKK